MTAVLTCPLCGGGMKMLTSSVNLNGEDGKAILVCDACTAEAMLEVRLTVTRRPLSVARNHHSPRELYWPLDPIERRVAQHTAGAAANGKTAEQAMQVLSREGDQPHWLLADMLGMDRGSVYRLRKRGGLSTTQADRLATSLECHPRDLWPDWDERLDASVDATSETP